MATKTAIGICRSGAFRPMDIMARRAGHGRRRKVAAALCQQSYLISMYIWLVGRINWTCCQILIQRLIGKISKCRSQLMALSSVVTQRALVHLAIANKLHRVENAVTGTLALL